MNPIAPIYIYIILRNIDPNPLQREIVAHLAPSVSALSIQIKIAPIYSRLNFKLPLSLSPGQDKETRAACPRSINFSRERCNLLRHQRNDVNSRERVKKATRASN